MLQAAALPLHGSRSEVDLPISPPATAPNKGVLPRLTVQAHGHDLGGLASRLKELQAWLAGDLQQVEEALQAFQGPNGAQRAGHHLLAAGGKRLRPVCTLIAARMGPRQEPDARREARDLAVAVELVHAATLLHDDVVDMADSRRGLPTARLMQSNEISIYAGDWLLVEALRRIVATGHIGLVKAALDTVQHMVFAEVQQAERARSLAADVPGYFEVIDGKTAALFRWALQAGATAGGCDPKTAAALVRYGGELGVAFQLIDDVLDLGGDSQKTGKALFADLAEGKITLPLAILLEREPGRRAQVAELAARCAEPDQRQLPETKQQCASIVEAVRACGALATARALAEERSQSARAALADLPACAEVSALEQIGHALLARDS